MKFREWRAIVHSRNSPGIPWPVADWISRRIRLAFHGGNELAQGCGNPLRAAGSIGGGQRSQRRFGRFNLSDAQQQSGIINPLGVGTGLSPGRIFGQRHQQIARAVGIEGFAEDLFALRA